MAISLACRVEQNHHKGTKNTKETQRAAFVPSLWTWCLYGERFFTLPVASWKFHLSRHEDQVVLPLGQRRQVDLLDLPTRMLHCAAERGLAGDVADQPDCRWVETGWHVDGAPFRLVDHGTK